MEIKEVILEAWVPGKRKMKRTKEKWYVVKFGDREFYMPEEIKDRFVSKIYHGSTFSLYFDGDRFFTDDKYHIPHESNIMMWYNFIVLRNDVELFKPENLTLLANDNGLGLYLIKNNNEPIIYKQGNLYTVEDYPGMVVTFEKEKPVNEETYDLLIRLNRYNDNAKYIKRYTPVAFTGGRDFHNIRILDYNDVKVYRSENIEEHRIIAIENAELVCRGNNYVAIKGDKTYIVMDHYYLPISSNFIRLENAIATYKNKHRMYEYVIPDAIKVINKSQERFQFGSIIVSGERIIVEVPSLDSDITVRTWIRKAEPVLTNLECKLQYYKEHTYQEKYITESGEVKTSTVKVSIPAELDYNMLKPELVKEKTYKIKDFINQPAELSYN